MCSGCCSSQDDREGVDLRGEGLCAEGMRREDCRSAIDFVSWGSINVARSAKPTLKKLQMVRNTKTHVYKPVSINDQQILLSTAGSTAGDHNTSPLLVNTHLSQPGCKYKMKQTAEPWKHVEGFDRM